MSAVERNKKAVDRFHRLLAISLPSYYLKSDKVTLISFPYQQHAGKTAI